MYWNKHFLPPENIFLNDELPDTRHGRGSPRSPGETGNRTRPNRRPAFPSVGLKRSACSMSSDVCRRSVRSSPIAPFTMKTVYPNDAGRERIGAPGSLHGKAGETKSAEWRLIPVRRRVYS